MSTRPDDSWSTGRLVSPVSPLREPLEVDCSRWESDIPAEKWSTGRLESVCQSLPLVSGDVVLPAAACLEISVHLAPEVDPGGVMLFATRLIQSVHDTFPELGLKYDPMRSRAKAGNVVIGLTSSKGAETEQKLDAIALSIRTLVEGFPLSTLNGIRLDRAA